MFWCFWKFLCCCLNNIFFNSSIKSRCNKTRRIKFVIIFIAFDSKVLYYESIMMMIWFLVTIIIKRNKVMTKYFGFVYFWTLNNITYGLYIHTMNLRYRAKRVLVFISPNFRVIFPIFLPPSFSHHSHNSPSLSFFFANILFVPSVTYVCVSYYHIFNMYFFRCHNHQRHTILIW